MTREEILKDTHLLKRFCKDVGLPINIYHEPYFSERLNTLDVIFHCKEKFETYVKELEPYQNAQEYLEYYNAVKENVIASIKCNLFFQGFNVEELPWRQKTYAYPSKDFYKMPLDGKSVVSIDMKKANFSALYTFDRRIFNGKHSWEDFLSNFTDNKHILQSKYIRQVIFGTCNPKRQVAYEKFLMGKLLDFLNTQINVKVFSFSSDEIIILPDQENIMQSYYIIKNLVEQWEYADIVRVSLFSLKKLPVTDGWRREIFDGEKTTFDFKKMSADYYHQAVKMEIGEHITMDDLVIYHDGHLARLLNPVF